MPQKTITYLSILAVVIGSIFLANGLILAWDPPTCNPPDCNVPAPLNVGTTEQYKEGDLGIGTTSLDPNHTLTVDGSMRSDGAYLEGNVDVGYSGTSYTLKVNNQNVCLANGSNCPSVPNLNGWSFGNDYFYDDGEEVIRASDEWLRLNQAGNFTSGIYTPGLIRADGDIRAPIFYDQNNTGYYVDPASTSNINAEYSEYLQTRRLDFKTPGGDSGQGNNPYAIFQEGGAWSYPYPDLRIAYHTGIKLGAHASYNGIRFYSDYDMSSLVMSVNDASTGGAGNVYMTNNLNVGGTAQAGRYYDDDSSYYIDSNVTSVMNSINMTGDLTVGGSITLGGKSRSQWLEGITVGFADCYTVNTRFSAPASDVWDYCADGYAVTGLRSAYTLQGFGGYAVLGFRCCRLTIN